MNLEYKWFHPWLKLYTPINFNKYNRIVDISSTKRCAGHHGDNERRHWFFDSVIIMKSSNGQFLKSRATKVVVLLRVCLLFGDALLPKEVLNWIQDNKPLESLLVRYQYSRNSQSFLDEHYSQETNRMPLVKLFFGSNNHLAVPICLLLVDLAIAVLLESIGTTINNKEHDDNDDEYITTMKHMDERIRPKYTNIFGFSEDDDTPLFPRSWLPLLSAQIYFYSPFTILASSMFFLSTNNLVFLAVLSAPVFIVSSENNQNIPLATFALSVATYMEPYMMTLVVPVWCMLRQRQQQYIFLAFFTSWLSSLHGLSYLLVGGDYSQYFHDALFDTQLPLYTQPNIGVVWYFTMQVFLRFRPFFGFMLAGTRWILPIPLAIRLGKYPLVMVRGCAPFLEMITALVYFCQYHVSHISADVDPLR